MLILFLFNASLLAAKKQIPIYTVLGLTRSGFYPMHDLPHEPLHRRCGYHTMLYYITFVLMVTVVVAHITVHLVNKNKHCIISVFTNPSEMPQHLLIFYRWKYVVHQWQIANGNNNLLFCSFLIVYFFGFPKADNDKDDRCTFSL